MGYRKCTDTLSNVDGLASAIDDGCGTFIDAYFCMGKLVSEMATIASYVGGKPGGGGHKALGGPYGAGTLAANVSLERAEAIARCEGKVYK